MNYKFWFHILLEQFIRVSGDRNQLNVPLFRHRARKPTEMKFYMRILQLKSLFEQVPRVVYPTKYD